MEMEDRAISEAERLNEKFGDLVMKMSKLLQTIDDAEVRAGLRARLNYYFVSKKEMTPEINNYLHEIEQIENASGILNLFIRENIIGYLNYQLLYEFQKVTEDDGMKKSIDEYAGAVESFLTNTTLETLAKVFKHELMPPVSCLYGLPRFKVCLDKTWKGEIEYQWKELLYSIMTIEKDFNWPHHIQISSIESKCIIIEYCVLPFIASAVVRDLTNSLILSALQAQGIEVELSEELIAMGKEENNELSAKKKVSIMHVF